MNRIIQIEMVYIFSMRMKRNRISLCNTFEWQWMNTSFWHNHILKWKRVPMPACQLIKSLEFRFQESKRICVCYLYFELLFFRVQTKNQWKRKKLCHSAFSSDSLTTLMEAYSALNEILLPNIDIISFVQLSNYSTIWKFTFFFIQWFNIQHWKLLDLETGLWSGTWNIPFYL